MLMKCALGVVVSVVLSACAVMPAVDTSYENRCEISSDKKILKVVDIAKDTNTFYSISGLVLLPITGVVSGVYVVVNNVYHLGEEAIVCGKQKV
jgi:hypothetical protein